MEIGTETSTNNTVKIYGKTYPCYEEENSVRFSDWLPDFFKDQEHFSSQDYYNEMVKLHPEFKKKWYEKLPSENEIEGLFVSALNGAAMDGANSVPQAERQLGIKIGGGYKYPDGITDIEYHASCFMETGFTTIPYIENKKNRAYMEAWQSLHYKNNELEVLQKHYDKLVELNPQLAEIKLDKTRKASLKLFRAGVQYNFPVKDIALFVSISEQGLQGKGIKSQEDNRIKEDLKAAGLEGLQLGWVPSSETIQYIGQEVARSREMGQNPIIIKPENNNSNNPLPQPKAKEKKGFIGWLKNKFSKSKKVIDPKAAKQLAALRQGFNPKTNPQGNSSAPVQKTTVDIAALKRSHQDTKS